MQVLLVVGGGGGGVDHQASTETVTLAQEMEEWTLHPSTPPEYPHRIGSQATRLDGKVFVTGGGDVGLKEGGDNNEILVWDPEQTSWSKVGSMAEARRFHGAVAVNYEVIRQYCVQSTTNPITDTIAP